MESVPDNADLPALWEPRFPRTPDCPSLGSCRRAGHGRRRSARGGTCGQGVAAHLTAPSFDLIADRLSQTSRSSRIWRGQTRSAAHAVPAVPSGRVSGRLRSCRTMARIVSWLTPKSAASERRLLVPASARIADSCSTFSLRALTSYRRGEATPHRDGHRRTSEGLIRKSGTGIRRGTKSSSMRSRSPSLPPCQP
jgi:hypothetical protein